MLGLLLSLLLGGSAGQVPPYRATPDLLAAAGLGCQVHTVESEGYQLQLHRVLPGPGPLRDHVRPEVNSRQIFWYTDCCILGWTGQWILDNVFFLGTLTWPAERM